MDVGDGARRRESDNGKQRGGDAFGLAVSRVAVAQVCESEGFQGSQGSAVDALADVAAWYVYNVGRSAASFANLSGRTECNVVDVVLALRDLAAATVGFAGASDLQRCVVGSGVVRDILYYLSSMEEVPFSRRVLNFPVLGGRRAFTSFARSGETPPGGHIPSWLPAFPDPSTYDRDSVENDGVRESVENAGVRDAEVVRDKRVWQQRKAPRSVFALKKLLAGNDSDVVVSLDEGDSGKGRLASAQGNPFLAPPLQFGEKEVSWLDFREWGALDKRATGLQGSPPAIEATRNGALNIGGDDERRILPTVRPTVQFGLHSGRRSSRSSFPLDIDASSGCDVWVCENDEKNGKKQRNDMVCRESRANPVEYRNLQDGS